MRFPVTPCTPQSETLLCRHETAHDRFEFAATDPVSALHHFRAATRTE